MEQSDYRTPQANSPERTRQLSAQTVPPSQPFTPQSWDRDGLIDYGEAPDVTDFCGRSTELTQLAQWVEVDRCRLVAILGMGGIGKTALVTKLAQQVQPNFTVVVWRSLRNAPPLNYLLRKLIQGCSRQIEIPEFDEPISDQISRLIYCLQEQRCLLILDNVEAILPSQLNPKSSQSAEYAELFERIGESPHQSCVLLTSREKPETIVPLAGDKLPVRTFALHGLNASESDYLFDRKGLSAASQARGRLREIYSGNPLALNIVATSICDLFAGDINEFLAVEVSIFSGIRQLLDCQFDRLSAAEQQVMYWLAIERNWISSVDLHSQMIPVTTKPRLLETLENLSRKSLIESSWGKFTQQAVVMEYMVERLITGIVAEFQDRVMEIATDNLPHCLPLWLSYPLLEAQSPEYIHAIQTRLILKPIGSQLQLQFGNQLAEHLKSILASLQTHYQGSLNYGGGNLINLCRYLQIELTGWNFSSLPIWQADLQGATLHDVNFTGVNFAGSVFTRTFGWVSTLAFSPDSQTLATGEYRGDVCLWGVSDKSLIHKFTGHTNWIWSISFSPDGRILATASQDSTIRLWDLATGAVIHVLQADLYHVISLSFHPGGEVLATGHGNGEIRLWDVLTGTLINSQSAHSQQIFSIEFSPDGRLLATGGDDHTVKIWAMSECASHLLLELTLTTHTQRVWSVRFSPDGRFLATGSNDTTVQLWDISTWAAIKVVPVYPNWLFSIGFSPDSQQLAVPTSQNEVNIWAIRAEEPEPRAVATLRGHQALVSTLQFSPDGQLLATASSDRQIRLWDTRTWQELHLWRGYNNWIPAVVFSPNGLEIVTGTQDGILRVWDAQTGTLIQQITKERRSVLSLDYSPDGSSIASGNSDGNVRLWAATTGDLLYSLSTQHGAVWTVRFSPDSRLIASSSIDHKISIWSVTGELVTMIIGHSSLVKSIAFSPDSQILATASFDTCWRLWDVATSQLLGCYAGHTNWIWGIVFSPDGRAIVTCSADRTAKLWDVTTGKLLQTFTGHTDEVMTVAFSPNGQKFATGAADCTIKIWDIERGMVDRTLTGHLDRVLSISYSPDSQYLVSGSADETFKLWDLTTGDCLRTDRPLSPYAGMNITQVTGLNPATIDSLKILGAVEMPNQ